MFNLLIDTCVWLDLAKDPAQRPLIGMIEELMKMNRLSLILPRTVVTEFDSNKARIIQDSGKSLSAVVKRAKEAVEKFGDPKKKKTVLEQLDDVNHKIPQLGESVAGAVREIESLFRASGVIEINDAIMIKAARRAIDKKAPFHRQKNSMNDAILMEVYGACVQAKVTAGNRFAFITHNKTDFSAVNESERLPHPDFAIYFSKIKSRYFIRLSEALQKISPSLISDLMINQEFITEPRSLSEILNAEHTLTNKVWFNRHKITAYRIQKGKVKIINRDEHSAKTSSMTIIKDVWEGAQKSAQKLEKLYGIENLGPWDDFEWGMINGKLSALRWMMGDEWDELYT